MTNREWLATLSDKELALFLTTGVPIIAVEHGRCAQLQCTLSISDLKWRFAQSTTGIEQWFNSPQEFIIDKTIMEGR